MSLLFRLECIAAWVSSGETEGKSGRSYIGSFPQPLLVQVPGCLAVGTDCVPSYCSYLCQHYVQYPGASLPRFSWCRSQGQ